MKRTTLILDEHALREIKQIAAAENRTLSAVVDEFLRSAIEARRKRRPARRRPFRLPSYDMGKARVDIADRNALYECMEER